MGKYTGHFVYKYVLNDEIIYIGKSDANVLTRIRQHGKKGDNLPVESFDEINSAQIYICKLANSIMSDVIESALINKYNPKWNRAKTPESVSWVGFDIPNLHWEELKKEALLCRNSAAGLPVDNANKLKSQFVWYYEKYCQLEIINCVLKAAMDELPNKECSARIRISDKNKLYRLFFGSYSLEIKNNIFSYGTILGDDSFWWYDMTLYNGWKNHMQIFDREIAAKKMLLEERINALKQYHPNQLREKQLSNSNTQFSKCINQFSKKYKSEYEKYGISIVVLKSDSPGIEYFVDIVS